MCRGTGSSKFHRLIFFHIASKLTDTPKNIRPQKHSAYHKNLYAYDTLSKRTVTILIIVGVILIGSFLLFVPAPISIILSLYIFFALGFFMIGNKYYEKKSHEYDQD